MQEKFNEAIQIREENKSRFAWTFGLTVLLDGALIFASQYIPLPHLSQGQSFAGMAVKSSIFNDMFLFSFGAFIALIAAWLGSILIKTQQTRLNLHPIDFGKKAFLLTAFGFVISLIGLLIPFLFPTASFNVVLVIIIISMLIWITAAVLDGMMMYQTLSKRWYNWFNGLSIVITAVVAILLQF